MLILQALFAPQPHQPSSLWFLQPSHCLQLREQPRFLDSPSPKELEAITEHTKLLRDECGAVSGLCTVIHERSVEKRFGTTYGPNYLCPPATNTFLSQIEFICAAWQLSWLLFFSWGTQPHADAIYTPGNLFLQPYFPNKTRLVSHPKGESRDLWLWEMPWHFVRSKSRVLAKCQLCNCVLWTCNSSFLANSCWIPPRCDWGQSQVAVKPKNKLHHEHHNHKPSFSPGSVLTGIFMLFFSSHNPFTIAGLNRNHKRKSLARFLFESQVRNPGEYKWHTKPHFPHSPQQQLGSAQLLPI